MMLKFDLGNRVWQWVTLFTLAFIWGSSFILMKKGLESFSNTQVASIRIFASFLILLPFTIKNLNKIDRKNFKSLVVVGFIGTFIPAYLFTKAQTRIDSSLAGMLNSLTPLFTLIIGVLLYRSKINLRKFSGIILGLIGALGLIYKDASSFTSINYYSLFVIAATICYGITANEIKSKLKSLDGLYITAFGFLFTGPFAGALLFTSPLPDPASDPNMFSNLIYILMLAFFGSVLALILFNTLIKKTPVLFSVSVTYLIPIFAILWGLFDGESIYLSQLLMMGIILIGIFLVNKPDRS